MADLSSWIQTGVIVVGLGFTAASFRKDREHTQVSNILAFSERHRALRKDVYGRSGLNRIHLKHIDVLAEPATTAETEALSESFIEFEAGWKIAKIAYKEELRPLALDVGDFLSRPLAQAVWEEKKRFRNPNFVKFVERSLKNSPKKNLK